MSTTHQDTTHRRNVWVSPYVHDAVTRHLARRVAENGRQGVPTLREFVDSALLDKLQSEDPELVSQLV